MDSLLELKNPTKCNRLLKQAFQLVQNTYIRHLGMGYQFHYNLEQSFPLLRTNKMGQQPPQRPVWVVRTEFLWKDVKTIDRMLGGLGSFGRNEGFQFSHGSENYKNSSSSSSSLTKILPSSALHICCMLWPDMVVYKSLVDRAVNLNATEKRETYQMTWNRCQVSSWKELEHKCQALSL